MKLIELQFDHKQLLPKQIDAAIKAQREMRENLMTEARRIIANIRHGYESERECDRLDEILEYLL